MAWDDSHLNTRSEYTGIILLCVRANVRLLLKPEFDF